MGSITRWPWQAPKVAEPSPQAAELSLSTEWNTGDWAAMFGLAEEGASTAGKVARSTALAIPAIVKARNVMCGVLGSLPLHCMNKEGVRISHSLLEWPESMHGRVRAVTMSMTYEDLLFEGTCLWLVIQRDSQGIVTVVERQPWDTWTQNPTTGVISAGGRERNADEVILFESARPPLLTAGANTIRMLRRLEISAMLHNESPEMLEYFQAQVGRSLPDDETIQNWLTDWTSKRKRRVAGYVPDGMERHEVKGHTAEEMQHIAQREFAIGEAARLCDIPPHWMGLSTVSRTYTNSQDERRDWLDLSASPLIVPVEQRLSLIFPHGQYVKTNMDAFLRANTKERYETYAIGLTHNFIKNEEVRGSEDLPPMGETP